MADRKRFPSRSWNPRPAALVIALAVLGAALHPAVQAKAKALAVLAEGLGAPFPRPFAPFVTRDLTSLGGVDGDLYEPRRGAPGILLLPGAAPRGKDDPRAVRLARSLARAGRTVFVPTLRLSDKAFDRADIDDIRRAAAALAERTGSRILVFGISYGGSFALIAAADRSAPSVIYKVAVFGAYYDLVGLIQAAATGVSVVGERRVSWRPDPRAREVLREAALQLVEEEDRPSLRKALEGEADAAQLSPDAAAAYRLVTNRDPARTFALAREVGQHGRMLIERFSPAHAADEIEVPVIALHSTDDPVTPYGEALRLERGLEDVRLVTVELFRHVDLDRASLFEAVPDLLRAWRFASWVLRL